MAVSGRRKPVTEEQRQEIKRLSQSGIKISDVVKAIGLSYSTVHRILKEPVLSVPTTIITSQPKRKYDVRPKNNMVTLISCDKDTAINILRSLQ